MSNQYAKDIAVRYIEDLTNTRSSIKIWGNNINGNIGKQLVEEEARFRCLYMFWGNLALILSGKRSIEAPKDYYDEDGWKHDEAIEPHQEWGETEI